MLFTRSRRFARATTNPGWVTMVNHIRWYFNKETLMYSSDPSGLMSEELIKVLKIQKKPGGLLVRIPNDVVRKINLTGDEKVKVYLDEKKKRIIYEVV